MKVEIVSDVICPWCYIGKRRFEKALALVQGELEVEVAWRPFQLNPDMPRQGMPRAEYRKAKFGSVERGRQLDARVAAEGQGEGIAFAFDRMERTPNTLAAHQLIDLAQKQGRAAAVVDALFRAYFEEARDIGDEAVLRDIAARHGVADWPSAANEKEVAEAEESFRALGISAVPTFVLGRRLGVSGAHPAEALASALREAASSSG
ncbi:MAG TPA: DsbA family oxidoreductase [Burkholderiales bacterium]|nr:DsbA family oxidoreductase [Burkholderiales bacterium]